MIQVGFGLQLAKTLSYPVIMLIPTFRCTVRSQSTNITDRWTDRQTDVILVVLVAYAPHAIYAFRALI